MLLGNNGYTMESNIIKWLFEILEEWNEEERAKFLFYVTGKNILCVSN